VHCKIYHTRFFWDILKPLYDNIYEANINEIESPTLVKKANQCWCGFIDFVSNFVKKQIPWILGFDDTINQRSGLRTKLLFYER
jgi:hypothetical protein